MSWSPTKRGLEKSGRQSLIATAWRRLDGRRLFEWASRLGYAARGVVYLGLGAIVFLAAVDLTPQATGAKAMLSAWARWPFGLALIAVMAVGLSCFAAWRGLQAFFDADGHGRSPKALAVRLGQAVSGVVYGALAMSAFELLDTFEDFGEADETETAQSVAAEVLALPQGDTILLAAGGLLLAVGVGNVIQGLAQDFAKRLQCSERLCRRVVPLAKIGYAARGLATLPTGLFLVRAGLEVRSSEARSWGGALQVIESQPFGTWLLGLVALGLVAFGLFGLVEAVFRRIRPAIDL